MNTSVAWINQYLDPPASAHEQADLLTRAGFPVESREDVRVPDGTTDVRQDIELTSNRGDCLSHIGLAREIAAVSGRRLKLPTPSPKPSGPTASSVARVTNREPDLCPLYLARIIRGVKVGPSPAWLANRLIARGDIPRNNIVDASNFVLFELGQPTHVFDLAKLLNPGKPEIIVRRAHANEPFLPIGEGEKEIKLSTDDLVIADAQRAVAIAGVKGGALTAVTNSTTDILIEIATFAPTTVRNTGRRLGIASDSAYRFERGVHPGQLESAADRIVELILQLCGGTLCKDTLSAGKPIPPQRQISLRPDRARAILGIPITDQQMTDALSRLGFLHKAAKGAISCSIPYPRIDIEREIDLIEEVGRIHGLDHIPIADSIPIRVAPPQPYELAQRAVNDALVGMGYIETVTHSLIAENEAAAFLPPGPGFQLTRLAEQRIVADPILRPSIIPSLLRVFALNRDNGVPSVQLFETASTFAQLSGGDQKSIERVNLAFLHPAADAQHAIRQARGVIDRLVQIVLGNDVKIEVEPTTRLPWFTSWGAGAIKLNNQILGTFGMLSPSVTSIFGVADPLLTAEIGLPEHYHRYPPLSQARALPSFPAIERDVSAIVDDSLAWVEVKSAVASLRLAHLEAIEFITTFRGKQIGAGKKSLTLRARFRAPDRTLRHDEVDPQIASLISTLQKQFHAEIRK
ncbi:MAG: phenylalanine--tRNA ligase subunit beta [Phycisphaerales bacterium]|nr:phenylalanine--tRNA ligase subunit beta [Phycisphaerales bacterium]MCI0629750.1 phenylalanine--tRNA ligase subunit beta [Phycisphaerales bacterium]MCI0674402.1 phenylalanine--tRNA ligase subunit beta [Phycisphaerales bacterium]